MELDTSVPHEARMYDYWLGGKDNFAADRALGDAIRAQLPTIGVMAQANRAVMRRMARHLAEAGIDQFLDVGTGIPTEPNLHQVVQAVRPEARVLYVDSDPIVLTHARALMLGTPEGETRFLQADFREPDAILDSAELRETLDLSRPVALMLVAILMYFDPDDGGHDPYPTVTRLLDALPSGSCLAITHPTGDFNAEAAAAVQRVGKQAGMTILPRGEDEVGRFFTGLELLDPGLVPVLDWRPDEPVDDSRSAYYWAGVGRKP